eukprot:3997528-Amphidinium_carterae.1
MAACVVPCSCSLYVDGSSFAGRISFISGLVVLYFLLPFVPLAALGCLVPSVILGRQGTLKATLRQQGWMLVTRCQWILEASL